MFCTHGLIARGANRDEVFKCCRPADCLSLPMTCLEVCYIHDITTPGSCTLCPEILSRISQPCLPFERLWNRFFTADWLLGPLCFIETALCLIESVLCCGCCGWFGHHLHLDRICSQALGELPLAACLACLPCLPACLACLPCLAKLDLRHPK